MENALPITKNVAIDYRWHSYRSFSMPHICGARTQQSWRGYRVYEAPVPTGRRVDAAYMRRSARKG